MNQFYPGEQRVEAIVVNLETWSALFEAEIVPRGVKGGRSHTVLGGRECAMPSAKCERLRR